jgi:multicomponent Na+:H+ antiporter subunit C
METATVYMLAAGLLVALGFYAAMTSPNLLRKLLGINLVGNGVFLFMIATAQPGEASGLPDPVPQAMVLTGIVVAVCATAFALSLIVRFHALTGKLTLEDSPHE